MAKILYICEYGTLNGGERSLLAWLPWAAKAGHEPLLLVPRQGRFPDKLRAAAHRTVYWPRENGGAGRASLAQRRADLRNVFQEFSPDLVHANSLSMSRLAGPVAKELGIGSIGHLRDIVRVSPQAMADINANGRVLAVSQATLAWHAAQGLDAARAEVLYNGVDLAEFAPRPPCGYLHRELQLPPHAALLAAIGQIGMRKGTDLFLDAAAAVAAVEDDVHFLVVGERCSGKREAIEFEQRLHDRAARPPLAGRVHFLGYRSDVPRLLNETALLVHAARQEPLGRVLLEGAASGVPIVAADVGGTREILGPQPLAPAADAEAIAAAALRALRDRPWAAASAAAARRRIAERFDIRLSAQRLFEQYA